MVSRAAPPNFFTTLLTLTLHIAYDYPVSPAGDSRCCVHKALRGRLPRLERKGRMRA